jgi:hypothetical protein
VATPTNGTSVKRRRSFKINADGSSNRQLREFSKILAATKGYGKITAVWMDTPQGPRLREVVIRGLDIEELAEADPGNIQRIGASQLDMSNNYYQGVLGRARLSFIAAIISAAVGVALFGTAVVISLTGNSVSAATLSAIGGAIVETISGLNFWLFGKTASQLDSFHVRLDRIQGFLLANSVCANINDRAHQDLVRGRLVGSMLGVKDSEQDVVPDKSDKSPVGSGAPNQGH